MSVLTRLIQMRPRHPQSVIWALSDGNLWPWTAVYVRKADHRQAHSRERGAMAIRRQNERDDEYARPAKQRNSWDDGVRVRTAMAPWSVLVAVLLLGIAVTSLVMWLVARAVTTLVQLS
jgi:hypothetical protein